MKARMKKLILISIPVVVLALLVVLGSALADGPARDPVSIYGSEVNVAAPGGPFGKATLTIRGEEFVGTVLILTGDREPRGDGEYAPAAKHVFTFTDENNEEIGGLTTVGGEYIVPTDEDPLILNLHGDADITEATGVFEGVSGELRISAQIDLHVFQANFHANGVVSGYGG